MKNGNFGDIATVTRQYGDAFATRFAQLYRNIAMRRANRLTRKPSQR